MTIITAIMTVLSFYPFTWEQTLILFGLIKGLYDAVVKKQWAKVEEIIRVEAMDLFTKALADEEKRDRVVMAVWNKMPKTLRAIATAEQVEKFVDQIYVTYVKPQARREQIEKGTDKELVKGQTFVSDINPATEKYLQELVEFTFTDNKTDNIFG